MQWIHASVPNDKHNDKFISKEHGGPWGEQLPPPPKLPKRRR